MRNGVRIFFVVFGECKEWSAIENNHSITTLKKICFFPIFPVFAKNLPFYDKICRMFLAVFAPKKAQKGAFLASLKNIILYQ